jgi:hypothetical protein
MREWNGRVLFDTRENNGGTLTLGLLLKPKILVAK